MRSLITIALLHLAPVPGAIARNRAGCEAAFEQAAAAGAQWIVTPELVTCGLQFARTISTDWIHPQPDPWMTRLCQLVKTLKVTVFLAVPEKDSGRLYNSVFVVDSTGKFVGKHRKINVASDSCAWSHPGETVSPVQCDGIQVGLLVCADACSPGIAATLKAQGVQMLISPASWGPGFHGPNGEWEARTRETGLPLIVCNRTGPEQTLEFRKAESLVVKQGRRLLSHRSDEPAILTFDWKVETMSPLSGGSFHVSELTAPLGFLPRKLLSRESLGRRQAVDRLD